MVSNERMVRTGREDIEDGERGKGKWRGMGGREGMEGREACWSSVGVCGNCKIYCFAWKIVMV